VAYDLNDPDKLLLSQVSLLVLEDKLQGNLDPHAQRLARLMRGLLPIVRQWSLLYLLDLVIESLQELSAECILSLDRDLL
jgi:hypothetical protein